MGFTRGGLKVKAGLFRGNANVCANVPKRITSKHNRQCLGSYPVPPEHELLWKNRRTIPGGYFLQGNSPFQMKFVYPLIHQGYARVWAKLSQGFWWMIWPTTMAIVGWQTIEHLNKLYLKRIHYY